ncbi:hypothetical protein ACJX0J_006470 [Zea mays]
MAILDIEWFHFGSVLMIHFLGGRFIPTYFTAFQQQRLLAANRRALDMNPANLYCALEPVIDFATAQNRFGFWNPMGSMGKYLIEHLQEYRSTGSLNIFIRQGSTKYLVALIGVIISKQQRMLTIYYKKA